MLTYIPRPKHTYHAGPHVSARLVRTSYGKSYLPLYIYKPTNKKSAVWL